MSNIPTDAGTALSVGDPLFAYEANLFKDRGLSTLVMVGLFSSSDDTIVDHNLDVVRDIVSFLMQYHNKDHINGKMFTSLLYQSGLWLLAFIDKDIVIEMTFSKQITLPLTKNLNKAKKILINLAQYMINTYFDCVERKKKHFFSHDVQSPAMSLIYLLIHLNKKHNLGLAEDIDNLFAGMVARLSILQRSIDETEHASFAIFCSYLKRMGYTYIAEQVSGLTDKAKKDRGGSIHRLYYVNHIKRPIVTFDSSLFEQFDKDIFVTPNE